MRYRNLLISALIGWYLLIPPYGSAQTPLSRWEQMYVFDSAAECAQAHARLVDFQQTQTGKVLTHHTSGMGKIRVDAFLAQCIASNDPRLKAP